MALSYYSNWGTFQQLNPENLNGFSETEQLTPEHELLLGLMNDVQFAFPDAYSNNIDHLFHPNQEEDSFFFYPSAESSNPLLLSYLSTEIDYNLPSVHYLSHNNIPSEPIFELDREPFNYVPKRQKLCHNYNEDIVYASDFQCKNPLFNPPCPTLQNYYPLPPPPPPELAGAPSLLDFPIGPPVYSDGSCDQSLKKLPGNGGSLSAQSIAARQRRRKITEKTQELGKLIPGGQKMNTAEMFQAAYKYIKYIQTQVGILEFMASDHHQEKSTENGERIFSEEKQGLVESPLIQEKLYSAEQCLVPLEFVHELINGDDHKIFQSKPQLLKDVKHLFPIKEN